MASKRGDSFEQVIAFILHSGGFTVKEQPHQVRLGGKVIGDLDVLAVDPKSQSVVGVSCKEWFGSVPGSQEFSHFVEMLEVEGLRHGIFASANDISDAILPRLEFVRNQKGINIMLLAGEKIENLRNLAFSKQDWQVDDMLRTGLGLQVSKRTLGDTIAAQKMSIGGKTVRCKNLIPVNYWVQAPDYIQDQTFSPEEANLRLSPYLVIKYSLHVEARMPGTGEVLDQLDEEGISIIDAEKGGEITDELIEKHTEDFFEHAEVEGQVEEKGFTVSKIDPKINTNEYISQLRNELAADNELRVPYETSKGERREIIKRASPSDVKIDFADIVYVPVWNVVFKIGKHRYKRTYFAYDGSVISDEMEKCELCKGDTVAACEECGNTLCADHREECKTCGKVICEESSVSCVDCDSLFCSNHKPTKRCGSCKYEICDSCAVNSCSVCNTLVCHDHYKECTECRKLICDKHVISKRYAMIPKVFCTNECLQKFDSHYSSSGLLGKFKKIVK